MSEDLSIDGPGSPVSLNKFLQSKDAPEPTKELICLIDDGCGIAQDAPNIVYINPEDCSEQALYFSSVFDGENLPASLYKYMLYMFCDDELWKVMPLVLTQDQRDEFKADEDYKKICNMIKYCKDNTEARQVIGLIQLVSGTLHAAKKMGTGVRFFIHEPETFMHPKRQQKIVSLLMQIKQDYGFNSEEQTTKIG